MIGILTVVARNAGIEVQKCRPIALKDVIKAMEEFADDDAFEEVTMTYKLWTANDKPDDLPEPALLNTL